MDTSKLKKFAQYTRRYLIEQVGIKLKAVLQKDNNAQRENPKAIKDLEKLIKESSVEQVAEKIAYIWFNRFCALRFMDLHHYTPLGIVSPREGQTQPEILSDAKQNHFNENIVPSSMQIKVFGLLNGSLPSNNPQTEAYKLLLTSACNFLNQTMPYLFEPIQDHTELLMPDDLLSESSILSNIREAMNIETCKDVEVIGWLYQYYISEKKDEVFAGLKKNKKITPELIPAATQLFTPHWIVKYLVENSLGRLWMLNKAQSRLYETMEYYIPSDQEDKEFIKLNSLEEIKFCDPACGSGHILVYAFDLLYQIYQEEGYDPIEIPKLILTHNLFGIEIDERAGQLASLALAMKARQYDKRFFTRKTGNGQSIEPQICILNKIDFTREYKQAYSEQLFDNIAETTFDQEWRRIIHRLCKEGIRETALIHDLELFKESDNQGSLVKPNLSQNEIQKLHQLLSCPSTFGANSMFADLLINQIKTAIRQLDFLSSKYHVVAANPPYMGGKGMNDRLKSFAQGSYPDSKSDLFAMFIERGLDMVLSRGYSAMVTMQSWMFLSSYENLRKRILDKNTISNMAHLGPRAFDSIGGEVVQTTAFTIQNIHQPNAKGSFLRLIDENSEVEKAIALKKIITQLKAVKDHA